MTFKHKVQSLIVAGWLTFQEDGPNVKTNPFASHRGLAVNVIEEYEPQRLKQDVITFRRFILKALCEVDIICFDEGQGGYLINTPGGST